jgi:sigma-B regulation protein RsbU (phosphoserine phosphatase)
MHVSEEVAPAGIDAPAPRGRVLVADDQADVLRAARLILKINGYAVTTVSSPARVLEEIRRAEAGGFDLLLMDLNYARDTTSGHEGLELVARVHELDPDLPIVAMTGWSTVPLAVATLREGACDFVEKPWDNERLLAAVHAEVAAGRRRRRGHRLDADARDVQQRLLVRAIQPVEGYDVGVAWSTAEDLGGDAYAVSALPGGRLGLAIADGCGKGTPAALLMANAQATLDDLMVAALPPAEVLTRLGRALGRRLGNDRFVSMTYAVLDQRAGTVAYSNAGHPPPLLLRGGTVRRLERGGPVLGPVVHARYEEEVLPLAPGDRLVLVTDGILEASPDGPGGEELGETRLIAHLARCDGVPAAEAARAVLTFARDFAGGRLGDDATAVVADVMPV